MVGGGRLRLFDNISVGEGRPEGVTWGTTATITCDARSEGEGLYYSNARWYEPTTGRFLTEDPARDGAAWYAYCFNSPMRYVDPTGLRQTFFQKALSAAISSAAERSPRVASLVRDSTEVTVTRNVYKGEQIKDQPESYYEDNLSVRVFGMELNNIQVQSTVDYTERFPATNTIPAGSEFDATIGLSVSGNIRGVGLDQGHDQDQGGSEGRLLVPWAMEGG